MYYLIVLINVVDVFFFFRMQLGYLILGLFIFVYIFLVENKINVLMKLILIISNGFERKIY